MSLLRGASSRKRLVFLVLAAALVVGRWWSSETGSAAGIEALYEQRASDVVVEFSGAVDRVLRDDLHGSRHQRFVVRLEGGHTVLVAHNIDLAPRVPLDRGDRVEIRGEYEWNDRGGVVHWTHHDPQRRRPGGWIRFDGETYR